MKLGAYIRQLTPDQLRVYAEDCETSVAYIQIHLLHARKTPRPELMKKLSANSGGHVTELEVLQHFGLIGSLDDSSITTDDAA